MGLGSASELISIGWAGATSPHVRAGDILHIDIVIDAKTGERFFTDKSKALALDEADKAYVQQEQPYQPPQILVTVAQPAGAIEKKRLGVSYYALAVDMEAAAVARLARARGLPFSAIKAVSDELGLGAARPCAIHHATRTNARSSLWTARRLASSSLAPCARIGEGQ